MNMKKYVSLVLAVFLTVGVFAAPGSASDGFPSRAVTMIVPWAAGGGSDLGGRFIQPYLEEYLGVPVNIINPAGAGGWVGLEQLLAAPNDGYMFAMINSPAVFMGYLDPGAGRAHTIHSFELLANHVADYWTMVGRPGAWDSIEAFIEYARENEVTVGTSGVGAPGSMVVEMLRYHMDLNLTVVPFGGWSEIYAATLGGHVDIGTGGVGESFVAVQGGELEALAVFAPERSQFYPDVRAWPEIFPQYPIVVLSSRGFGVRAGTDPEIVATLTSALNHAINNPEGIQNLADIGLYVSYMDAYTYTSFMHQEEGNLRDLFSITLGW